MARNIKSKTFSLIFILLACFLFIHPSVQANNKFGIHILEPWDLPKATHLVNSSGGDWGYVTIVIREDDLDHDKWQDFFDTCRRDHLIPIVRLATKMMPGGFWSKPDLESLEKWPEFLNSLNWPVKQQIVVVFNEPNHNSEWGGQANPTEYGQVLDKLITSLKEANPNFFVLGAGLDQAAGNSRTTMDEVYFLQQMNQIIPNIFHRFDGWSSHSYPNHGFIGSPDDQGRATIRGYEWELGILQQLGLDKDLPIFITETGWPHQEGISSDNRLYEAEKTASLFEKAYQVWQADERVKAVTPFVLNFPSPPFDHFSWLDEKGNQYSQYDKVLGMSKTKAEPEQIQSYQVMKLDLIDILPTNYQYQGQVTIKNTGQWIIGERGEFHLLIKSTPDLNISVTPLSQGDLVFPDEEKTLAFTIKTGIQSAEHQLDFFNQKQTLYVFKPWDLKNTQVDLWQQLSSRLKLWWLSFKKE